MIRPSFIGTEAVSASAEAFAATPVLSHRRIPPDGVRLRRRNPVLANGPEMVSGITNTAGEVCRSLQAAGGRNLR